MALAPEAGSSMVTLWRMQVTTSCRMRRAGSWKSTSLVTTVGTPHRCRHGCEARAAAAGRSGAGAGSGPGRPGRRRRRAGAAAAARRSSSASSGTSTAIKPFGHVRRRRPSRGCSSPCRRASCRATAAGTGGNRPAGRSDRPGATVPSVRSRRQPTISRTPVAFAASWARTMPASAVAVDDGRAPRCRARLPVANSSSQDDAPRRNEKCEVTWSSA